jgi:hypothetical protein
VPRDRILTPDDVRRDEPTLPAALAKYGWPTLGELQGKLMFAVLDEDEHRDRYVSTHRDRNLTGRLMFVRSTTPSEPWAAMFKVNNAVPTLRDMQAFGRRSIDDPELTALQVYPEAEATEGALAKWWKNLWEPLTSESTDEAKDDDTQPEPGSKPEPEPLYDRTDPPESMSQPMEEESDEQGKDLTSEPKPTTREVDRRLRRELETVYGETRAEARERHKLAVAELEERVRLADAPESEELAIVLENARRSKAYREVLRQRLHVFIGENRKARILGLVRDGFLVTTTADEPQEDDAKNRERAASTLLSAAQYVSTDALLPNRRDGYVFEFPGAPVRCNVLVDADECEEALEHED